MKITEKFYSLQDIDPIEKIPQDYWLERFRNWRRDELLKSDWTQLPDAPVDAQAWATYRQKLRDLPADTKFPDVELPSRPS